MLEKFWGSRPKKIQVRGRRMSATVVTIRSPTLNVGGYGGASERLQYFVLLVSIAYTKSFNGDILRRKDGNNVVKQTLCGSARGWRYRRYFQTREGMRCPIYVGSVKMPPPPKRKCFRPSLLRGSSNTTLPPKRKRMRCGLLRRSINNGYDFGRCSRCTHWVLCLSLHVRSVPCMNECLTFEPCMRMQTHR